MKFKKLKKNDYSSDAFIGILMCFVGIGGLLDNKNIVIDLITLFGAILLIGLSIYKFRKEQSNICG